VFSNRELERKTDMDIVENNDADSVKRKVALLEKRFDVAASSNIKSHIGTINSRVLYGIMKETSPGPM
jgi:hypothetical protein